MADPIQLPSGNPDAGFDRPQPAQVEPFKWSLAAVVIGVLAVALGMIPPMAIGESPPMSPFEQREPPPKVEEEEPAMIELGLNNFVVKFRKPGEQQKKAEPPPHPVEDGKPWFMPGPAWGKRIVYGTTILSYCLALATVVVGSYGYVKERHPVLIYVALGAAALAIAWQYILLGVALGVMVVVILHLLENR
ncbi:MAG: hypothetical protein WD045_01325 [Pirellulaceae bacterium]